MGAESCRTRRDTDRVAPTSIAVDKENLDQPQTPSRSNARDRPKSYASTLDLHVLQIVDNSAFFSIAMYFLARPALGTRRHQLLLSRPGFDPDSFLTAKASHDPGTRASPRKDAFCTSTCFAAHNSSMSQSVAPPPSYHLAAHYDAGCTGNHCPIII